MVEKINIELFLDNLPKDCTTREIIKKISSLDIEQSDAQKRYIENLDAQSAALKLVTLGYRKEAKTDSRTLLSKLKKELQSKILLERWQNSS